MLHHLCNLILESPAIAKPRSMHLEAYVLKSTRPSGSGELAQTSPGHSNLGFALESSSQSNADRFSMRHRGRDESE